MKKIKQLKRENTKLKKDIRKYKKKINELEKYKKKISLIFKSKTKKLHIKRFDRLYEMRDELPEIISDFLEKLAKDLDSTLNHIENENIPNTNNRVEGYFRVTLPRKFKRIFRTLKGLNLRLKLSRLRWIERNILKPLRLD